MKSENGRRDVPIFDELARMLPRNQIGYVFPSPDTGKYLTAYELAKYWKQYCRDAGLMDTITADNGKQTEKTQVSPHCFRHTFATICYEAGVDARTAGGQRGSHGKGLYQPAKEPPERQRAAGQRTSFQGESCGGKILTNKRRQVCRFCVEPHAKQPQKKLKYAALKSG